MDFGHSAPLPAVGRAGCTARHSCGRRPVHHGIERRPSIKGGARHDALQWNAVVSRGIPASRQSPAFGDIDSSVRTSNSTRPCQIDVLAKGEDEVLLITGLVAIRQQIEDRQEGAGIFRVAELLQIARTPAHLEAAGVMLVGAGKEVVLKVETERATRIVLPRRIDRGNADCASDDACSAGFETMRDYRLRNEGSSVQWAASSMCSPACSTSCPMPWTVLQLVPKRAARVAIRIRINCFREAFIILRRRVTTSPTMPPRMTPHHGVKPYRDPQARLPALSLLDFKPSRECRERGFNEPGRPHRRLRNRGSARILLSFSKFQ